MDIIKLITPDSYSEAGNLIPLICTGYLLYSLHTFYTLPAVLHKKTTTVAINAWLAASMNLAMNLILIPRIGIYGAAITSICTYATYSFFGNYLYRKIEVIPFSRVAVFLIVVGGGALVGLSRYLDSRLTSQYQLIMHGILSLLIVISFLFFYRNSILSFVGIYREKNK